MTPKVVDFQLATLQKTHTPHKKVQTAGRLPLQAKQEAKGKAGF